MTFDLIPSKSGCFKFNLVQLLGQLIVSRVFTKLRCEYLSLKSRDICIKLPLHLL
jgi:hypothetical protein